MEHLCRSIEDVSSSRAEAYGGSIMTVIKHCLLPVRRGLLPLVLFALCPIADSVAQSAPTLGYAAAEKANPDRFDVFKKGLTELGYVEGKDVRIDIAKAFLMPTISV